MDLSEKIEKIKEWKTEKEIQLRAVQGSYVEDYETEQMLLALIRQLEETLDLLENQ